jgi:cerevisin
MKGIFALALAAAASASPVLIDSMQEDLAPLVSAENAKEIPNSYMIMFKDHVTHNLAASHHDWVHDLHTTTENRKTELRKRSQSPFVDELFHGLKHTYNIAGSLLGYSGHFDEGVIEQIRRHPDVSEVQSTILSMMDTRISIGASSTFTSLPRRLDAHCLYR